jgi:peptide/nickel transport system substrate-binding protein
MRMRTYLAASVAALVFAVTSAAHAQVEGGSVSVVVTPEPPMLMQALNQNGPTNMIAGNIYESLLRFNEALEPQPSLAQSWEVSEDGTVYTFTLQENVTWHDGEPFSADDVVFSLDVFLREVHPRWRPIVNNQVETIEKVDDNTVRLTLKQPFGPLLLAMETASAPIVPKHIYEGTDYASNPMNNTPIGTGPFKFQEWNRGSYVHLVKNEDYWMEGRPYLDEIYWRFIPDAAARAVAYETGDVDVLTGGAVDIFDVPRLSELENLRDEQGLGNVRPPRLDHRQPSRRDSRRPAVPPGPDARHRPRVRPRRRVERFRQSADRSDLVEDALLRRRGADLRLRSRKGA